MGKRRNAVLAVAATAAMVLTSMPGVASATATTPSPVIVVANGLNQPKKITLSGSGVLYVAESGLNTTPPGCTDGTQPACVSTTGSIAQVTRSGQVTRVATGLASLKGAEATVGPVEALVERDGKLLVLSQSAALDQKTGAVLPPSTLSTQLDALMTVSAGGKRVVPRANLGAYEFAHNPDNGAGAGDQPVFDSDPYGMVWYRGGVAIADAAGNDVLFWKDGKLSTLAVLPLVTEHVPAGLLGPGSPPTTVQAQPVPTAVAVGPDGALYISELGGGPYDVGDTNIYRLNRNGVLETVASGLTMVTDLAFDHNGRLLALEVDQAGLADPALKANGLPTAGALVRINRDGTKTTIASPGLIFPLGMAVGWDGFVYISNFGILQGSNDPSAPPGSGLGGQIVKVKLPR